MNIIRKAARKYNDIPVAAKATLWFVFASTLQRGMSLITTPIFTRLMSTEQYGQYSVYNSWLQIFTIITTLRLNWAVFNKGMSKYKNARDDYTSTMQTITLCLTGIVFGVYLMFHEQINSLTELPTFIMLAMFAELFVMPAVDFWSLRKRYEYQYKSVVLRTVVFTILNAAIGVIAVYISEEKGYARILSCVLVNFCFGISLFIYNRKKAGCWFRKEYAKFALLFVLPLLVHYFSQYVLDQFDRVMIQKLIDISSAGIYSVAYNAAMLLKIITQSINNALVPWQYEQLEKKQFKALDNILVVVYLIVAGCSLLFISFAPEIMYILADEKYYDAVYAIPPIMLGLFFMFMYTTIANVEFYYNETKFTMYISLFGAALNVVLNYVGIRCFGYIAAAYTTLICYMIFAAGHYIYMNKSVKKKLAIDKIFNTKRIAILSSIVLFLGIAIIFAYDKPLIRFVIVAMIILTAYMKRNRLAFLLKQLKK